MSEKELYNAVVLLEKLYFSNTFQKVLEQHNIVQVERTRLTDYTYKSTFRKGELTLTAYYFANHEVMFVQASALYSLFVIALDSVIEGITGMEIYLEKIKNDHSLIQMENRIVNEKGKCEKFPYMQLYGQELWHSPAFLLANREGLLQLREAIDVALQNGEYRHVTSSSDGDGYDLLIKRIEEDVEWSRVETPYTALSGKEENTIKPSELFSQYRTILEEE
ncbi:hypothetical protein [Bacillus sp. RAR_GA_16]|uniref:hypothetical protein n=1 Tax=Bacillus sp. RAR_GA_16 TaxID=2876774 RepID=UPI001CCAC31F|nr:hypothetical protein [Bacillus sp. RAR_GA_16]MCA0173260.1 hypothetical protein [Bacillus sp. RAR_GA_16]